MEKSKSADGSGTGNSWGGCGDNADSTHSSVQLSAYTAPTRHAIPKLPSVRVVISRRRIVEFNEHLVENYNKRADTENILIGCEQPVPSDRTIQAIGQIFFSALAEMTQVALSLPYGARSDHTVRQMLSARRGSGGGGSNKSGVGIIQATITKHRLLTLHSARARSTSKSRARLSIKAFSVPLGSAPTRSITRPSSASGSSRSTSST